MIQSLTSAVKQLTIGLTSRQVHINQCNVHHVSSLHVNIIETISRRLHFITIMMLPISLHFNIYMITTWTIIPRLLKLHARICGITSHLCS